MNTLRSCLLYSVIAAAAVLWLPAALAEDTAEEGTCPDRSLLINDSSASPRRLDVALRILWGNIGMAGQAKLSVDTALFLSDDAARYSIKPWCLKPHLRKDARTIRKVQGEEGATCPMSPKDDFSLRGLWACGMQIYGCHLCIADMIAPRCGKLINDDGSVNPDVWERAVLDEVAPIYEPGSDDQRNFFLMPYSNRGSSCTVDAAVMSF